MNQLQKGEKNGLFFYDYNPETEDQKSEILDGLKQENKVILPKYFYDEEGSKLFEQITELPEYYVTRTEIGLLQNHANNIIKEAGEDCILIEYGSGASTKIRLLLETLKPQAYVPLDISKDFLYDSVRQLRDEYPWLEIHATCLDYREEAKIPSQLCKQAKRVAFFPGSSFGNFNSNEASLFLQGVRSTIGDNGSFLIGVDLVKNLTTLESAYNDNQGVSEKFNLNILNHLNRLGSGDFKVNAFSHKAFFNKEFSRIEMHLISKVDQIVNLFGEKINFYAGENILTEYSHKFEPSQFSDKALKAGLSTKHFWTDSKHNFGLYWLESI